MSRFEVTATGHGSMTVTDVPDWTRKVLHLTIIALAFWWNPASAAEPAYPSRPIRIVVGYAPGGAIDVLSRQVGAKLQESVKVGVVVENKPGAAGLIAANEFVRATPDGYSLFVGTMTTMSLLPAARGNVRYDSERDFVPIAELGISGVVLVINPQKVPASNLAEFVAWGRKQPSIFLGTVGAGSLGHFGAVALADAEKIKMEPVHYKLIGDNITGLLNGDVHTMLAPYTVVAPFVQSGQLRALATGGATRSRVFPNVPTFTELGYPDLQFDNWTGLFAPARTPPEIINRLSADITNVTRDPETRAKLESAGLEVAGTTREGLARKVKEDGARWVRLVKKSGFKVQD